VLAVTKTRIFGPYRVSYAHADILEEQERSNAANVIFRTALGKHDAVEARLLGPGWSPLAWPFLLMQTHALKMKEPRSVRGSSTVRDHGGTKHLGPRTE
jgi:hypothetical protein